MSARANAAYNALAVEPKRIEGFVFRFLDPVKGEGRFHEIKERGKAFLRRGIREYVRTELRWSYIAILAMIVGGVVINFVMPHGWTVWPFVLAAGMMMLIHEAADRNLTGVPPFHVYALFFSALACWFVVLAVLSLVHPVILLIGLLVMGYYCTLGYLKQHERKRLIAKRRMEGRCIFCGAIADYDLAYCMNCGNEPDPDDAQLKRAAYAPRGGNIQQRARAALKPATPVEAARKKEQALINRRRESQFKKR
ncbi:MAG TPA: hypothetical protein VK797_25325 [Tepidisphaeraceae bacterium]|jgi:hypothetical protein|nr:hypothetical protein [Tepidisphaeraceae bacterium]